MTLFCNHYSSLINIVYSNLMSVFSVYYLTPLLMTLFLFVSYRFPYCYSPYLFMMFLVGVVFSLFLSLFFSRLFGNPTVFFSGFVPVGTPISMCPFVCMAETISYFIRPFVLILRPFMNISMGCLGAVGLGSICVGASGWSLLLMLMFFYEVFVALVHWFMVSSILSFSISH